MNDVEWRIDRRPIDYRDAVAIMERRVAAIAEVRAGEMVWLLEHPPLYTAGTSARQGDLIDAGRLPVIETGRGGQYTYHGPGQRVGYVMLDLRRRRLDVRRYVADLEQWVIDALARLGIEGERRQGRVGIWVARGGGREDKIAAIGVRVRRWVTYHGVALNRDPDLERFRGIVPCGIADERYGVTSLKALGHDVGEAELDAVLVEAFASAIGPAIGHAPTNEPTIATNMEPTAARR